MRRDYLSKLSLAARWYLPPAEAAEVLEDYRDIAEGRSGEELRRDVGTPKDAVGRLVELRAYHRWLTVFTALAVCLLLPMVDALATELSLLLYRLSGGYFLWGGAPATSRLTVLLFALGALLSLVWFRRGGEKGPGKAPPRGVVPLLVLLLLGMVWVWFLAWIILAEQWNIVDFLFPGHGRAVQRTLALFILFAGVAGMVGLIKARLGDRRWLAVYLMSLAGAGTAIFLWRMLTCMSLDSSANWQLPYWIQLIFITAVGLLGTGVSLC